MIDKQQSESDFAHLNALLDNLNQLLSDEYVALKNGDIDGMELLIEHKSELLRNIEGISKRIEPELSKVTVVGESQNSSQENSVPPYIQETLNRLVNCRQQNNINGGSIEANRNFSHSLLNILTGSETKNNIYDATGQFNHNQPGALSTEA